MFNKDNRRQSPASRPFSGSRFGSSSNSRFGGNRSGGSSPAGFRTGGPRRDYGNRGSSQAGSRGRGRGFKGQHIDVSKFINKAVVIEEAMSFVPEHKFVDFAIDEKIKSNIIKKGYVTPSPIQDRSIPHILRGADIVGIANTGTGKTAAFLLPLLDKVLKDKSQKVIIAAPTRELAIQIENELRDFSVGLGVFSVVTVGGAPIGKQISNLRRSHHFVIGTPGRIKDLIERKVLDLSLFKTVVLDEADRMLDMGFINDMKYMMDKMPKDKHTLFFSATMSPEIESLIKVFLKDPVSISVKTGDTAKSIDQDIVRILPGKTKIDILHDLLLKDGFTKVLVFGETKHGVEKLSQELVSRGFKSESIHGNKNHTKRQKALGLFKDNHIQILVATDVAARGIDVKDISHVINYDIPHTYADYVHRIGRTGRAGKNGKALTFVQ
jgi:superfamily II DNA/RNA helicase